MPPHSPRAIAAARALTIVACASAAAACFSLFRTWFPGSAGEIGAGYSYSFPRLYDGALWFRTSGLLQVPWFTPSFCGGLPAYANPQNDYFALPQLLDLALGPVAAIQATMAVFSALGFVGFYALVRSAFGGGRGGAIFAGGLFALNGFYLGHMVAGHLPFHAFMLTPLVAWGTLPSMSERRGASLALATCVAGAAIGYAIHAGGIAVVPLIALSTVAITLVHAATFGVRGADWGDSVARLTGVLVVGIALAAGKVTAMLAFVAHAPRQSSSGGIAGVRTAGDLVELVLVPLVSQPRMEHLRGVLVGGAESAGWSASDLELGVGPVPLVMLGVGALVGPVLLALRVRRGLRPGEKGRIGRSLGWGAALALLLAIPLYLSIHDPAIDRLDRLLSAVPLLRGTRAFFPLLSVFVPVAVLGSAIVVDRLIDWRAHWLVAIAGSALLFLGGQQRRDLGYGGGYRPEAIEAAHKELRESRFVPPIGSIAPPAATPEPAFPLGQTAAGVSTYPCDEPILQEPAETRGKTELHAGPVTDETGRAYNLLDPACFLFPEENQCAPGDRLEVEKKERFERFRAHEAVTFARPWWQRLADATSLVTLAAVMIVLLAWALGEWGR